MSEILRLENLSSGFIREDGSTRRIVNGVHLSLQRGQTYALLGESGSGKSFTALSIMGLLPYPAGRVLDGRVLLQGDEISRFSEKQMRAVRGRRISMIFQEPMTSLNPVMTVAQQMTEVLHWHTGLRGRAAEAKALAYLRAVKLADPEHKMRAYPHQLSGGMKQRVMIAMALAGEPDVLIADEPTTALDVTIQAQVLALMQEIQQRTGMAILLITHDMGVVSRMADEVAVMYAGQVVEQGPVARLFQAASHPYTRSLLRALPSVAQRGKDLQVLEAASVEAGGTDQCVFLSRCPQAETRCGQQAIAWQSHAGLNVRCLYPDRLEPPAPEQSSVSKVDVSKASQALLSVKQLRVHFPIRKGLLKRITARVRAVDGVDLELHAGETLALVGESGCGKTSVAKALLRLQKPFSAAKIRFDNEDLLALNDRQFRALRGDLQMVFQDPYASMNPRLTVQQIVAEGLQTRHPKMPADVLQAEVLQGLERVGLNAEMAQRYPHEFSGGQRQRISIARALALKPRLLICDEPTSALDVSVQAQILNLLRSLQQEFGLAYLFITHNLSVVSYLADRVAVMYLGRVVESGPLQEVLEKPAHPYTRSLLQAVPKVSEQHDFSVLDGETPSAINPPSGCYFHPRCPQADALCQKQYPASVQFGAVTVACHQATG